MKKWFKYFVYISIAFLIFALIKADYLIIPVVYNYSSLILSVTMLIAGFFFDSVSWLFSLRQYGYKNVNLKTCIVSSGLSVFGNYIPGKIWAIVGRSAYISKTHGFSEKETASISLNAQFISLWTGLIIGCAGFFIIGFERYWAILISSLLVVLTLVLFSRLAHNLLSFIIKKILKRKIEIPSLSIIKVLKVLPWYALIWLFWCLGFFLLAQSLSPSAVNPSVGFIFALAGTLGILAIIAPGGIGVREGILSLMLIMAGVNGPLAISISVTSRLWFLIGETFTFLLGLFLKISAKRIKIKE